MRTAAPTTPEERPEEITLLSPVLWVVAACYTLVGIGTAWVAIALAPWGLLLLIIALASFAAAVFCGAMAVGISRLEADPA